MRYYKVIDTPMWPNRWKVESVQWPGRDNSTTEFFKERSDADRECDRRNERERLKEEKKRNAT